MIPQQKNQQITFPLINDHFHLVNGKWIWTFWFVSIRNILAESVRIKQRELITVFRLVKDAKWYIFFSFIRTEEEVICLRAFSNEVFFVKKNIVVISVTNVLLIVIIVIVVNRVDFKNVWKKACQSKVLKWVEFRN